MFSFTNHKHPEADPAPEPQSKTDELQWPPQFEEFTEYQMKLTSAIEEHPPFGEWLCKYRNVNHLRKETGESMWGKSVEELQEIYVTSATKANHEKNAKRALAILHLEKNGDVYKMAKTKQAEEEEAYKVALAYFNSTQHTQSDKRAPHPPSTLNPTLEEYKWIASIAGKNMDDE
jgi:hypothetical protein